MSAVLATQQADPFHDAEEQRASFDGQDLRRHILTQSKRANVGHIGSALSVADILAVVYGDLLGPWGDRRASRDRFILSKGHASLALYSALALSGRIPEALLNSYCGNGSLLGVHPEWQLPGVDFSTGSLGMGLSFAVGAALAAKLQSSRRKVYVLLSDAECNEGATWEAAMFAAHHGLSALTAFVDVNGQQALGYTRDVLSADNLTERFKAFGWDAREVDGHDSEALRAACVAPGEGRPRILLCRTTFGKGVSFMQSQIKWHYLPMNDAEFAQAMQELSRS